MLSFRPRPPSTTNFRPTEKSIAKCFLLRYCNLSPAGSILPTNILCKDMSPVSESIQIDCHRGVYLLQVNTILASQKWKNKFTKTAFFSGNGCHCILCRRIYFNLIWKKTIYCGFTFIERKISFVNQIALHKKAVRIPFIHIIPLI